MAAQVVMYSKTTCPYCFRALSLLEDRGMTPDQLDLIQVDLHPERRREMIDLSQRTTVPQIFINGRHIGGSDDLAALDRQGGLTALLQAG